MSDTARMRWTTARRRSGSRAGGTAWGSSRRSATASRTRIEAFGGKLVVWADTQGNLNVLDGYCRHMGGDLTQGTVKGDEIACPFHDWRWGGDGKCKQIPYARRVPLRARTQKYPVVIRNDQLLVWHDIEGSEPDMDILPPELPGVGDRRVHRLDLGGRRRSPTPHCRELIDNVVDMAHFYYVHFAFPTSFRNVFEGHVATQFMESKGRPDKGGAATATPTCSSSPRRPTTGRRT